VRVVQVYKDYEPPVFGGIERSVRVLSEGLSARGADVTVVAASSRRSTSVERIAGVTVVRAATFGRVARAPVSPTVASWLRRLRPDVLHFHHPNPTGELACLLAHPRCPVVVTYHCDIVRQKRLLRLYRYPLRAFLHRADRILVTSPAALEGNVLLDPHRGRCEVLPLGIRAADLLETERTRETVSRLGGLRRPVVLFVGRLRPYKGLPVLIDAMAEIPGTLLVVGRGEMEDAIRTKVQREGRHESVLLAGDVPQEELAGYYRASDLFVLPSLDRSEALGLAMIEAMHCGLPVISTRVGTGTSHVNQDGVTGLEVAPGDPDALARAIRWMLAYPGRARAMAAAGKERAAAYSETAMIDRTARMYEELIGAGNRGRAVA